MDKSIKSVTQDDKIALGFDRKDDADHDLAKWQAVKNFSEKPLLFYPTKGAPPMPIVAFKTPRTEEYWVWPFDSLSP
jgi:hypothetical protein